MRLITRWNTALTALIITAGLAQAAVATPPSIDLLEVASIHSFGDMDHDEPGAPVAVWGDIAVIGIPSEDANGSDSGAVYVFRHTGLGWTESSRLVASDGEAHDQFGVSVAIDGDTIVIGALGDDDNGTDAGAVYVFRKVGTRWVEGTKLIASARVEGEPPSPSASGRDRIHKNKISFGIGTTRHYSSIPSSKTTMSVTASGTTHSTTTTRLSSRKAGERVGVERWTGKATTTVVPRPSFGSSVSVSGTAIMVGSSRNDESGRCLGAVHMFRSDGTGWIEQPKLMTSDPDPENAYAFSVAISGDTAVIGMYSDSENRHNPGMAYVFGFDGDNWYMRDSLRHSDSQAGDQFGRIVSIGGGTVMVGAVTRDDQGRSAASAHVYGFDGSRWRQQARLEPDSRNTGDSFGYMAVISDKAVVAGTRWYPDSTSRISEGHVYRLKNDQWVESAGSYNSMFPKDKRPR